MYFMFLADGFEETEALVTLDLLRRAGICVKTVGIGSDIISGAHNIAIKSDIDVNLFDTNLCDGIILPGGMPGTENLFADDTVQNALSFCYENNKLICAICAAPIILGRRGYLKNRKAVCFPGFESELTGAIVQEKKCIRDDNIITAKGAGCVFEFSHAIISFIKSELLADEIIEIIQHDKLLK